MREQGLEGGGLRLRFAFVGDRFAHDVSVHNGRSWISVLNSVEGTPAESWPTSPPLQSLELQERGAAGPVALLVGMAGKSHWSASVELDAAAGRLRFDVACRVPTGEVGWLGSQYQANWPPATCDERSALYIPRELAGKGLLIEIETDDNVRGPRLESGGNVVAIVASARSGPARAATIRWRYTISVSEVA